MNSSPDPPAPLDFPEAPSWREALRTWTRVALLSFGGPAGQIAVMHRILVDEKKWIGEERFLHALNYCMLLPGPEAQQLATYIGWMLHGVRGGLLAGGLFILPGFVSILALSLLYSTFQGAPFLSALFFGLKPAVLVIVVEALLRIGRRVLKTPAMSALAMGGFAAIHLFGVPFPVVVLAAAALGLIGSSGNAGIPSASERLGELPGRFGWRRVVAVSAVAIPIWFGPLLLAGRILGTDSVFWELGVFFSQAAMVTFGGAYSVLTYVAQHAVEGRGWLQASEMLDGLGLAETTPGPLIMVVQFVGYLAAFHSPAPLSPTAAAILASLLTTWVTFVPCFYWVFLGAPFVERLRGNRRLAGSLTCVTACVVGAILNLAVWFAWRTLFAETSRLTWGPLTTELPIWASIDLRAVGILATAAWLTFRLHWRTLPVLGIAVLLGLASTAIP